MGPGQEERLIRSHWLESVLLHHLALALLPAPPHPTPNPCLLLDLERK